MLPETMAKLYYKNKDLLKGIHLIFSVLYTSTFV